MTYFTDLNQSKSTLDIAVQTFLDPSELTPQSLYTLLESLSNKTDYSDLFFQANHRESWTLENGIIKETGYNIDVGVGLRAICQEKAALAYSNDISLKSLRNAVKTVINIARYGKQNRVDMGNPKKILIPSYHPSNPLKSISNNEKVNILKTLDKAARNYDNRVQQVIANITGNYEIILIVGSDGTFIADVRPLVRLGITVIVLEKNQSGQGTHGGGGRVDYSIFLDEFYIKEFAERAAERALLNLQAIPAPAGTMPVVLGAGWPGVILHEAVGHGLEGDFNRKASSAFNGKIGERVASKLCTVIDDGTLKGERGSLTIDDEGTPSQPNILIEKGILKGYLQDKLNGHLMKTCSTGNGRRESYAHLPLPRMTNTFMLAGIDHPTDIIRSVNRGLYAVSLGGGQVDITSGKFVFTTNEAYLIENGKITSPLKGATLIGNGPDILMQVSMVGNDLKLDSGIGTCGKEGQNIPVGIGLPTIKIDALTVGGTKA